MLYSIIFCFVLALTPASLARADAEPHTTTGTAPGAAPVPTGGDAQPQGKPRFEDTEVPFEPELLPGLQFSQEAPHNWTGDALIVGIYQDDLLAEDPPMGLVGLDEAFGGLVSGPIGKGQFSAAPGEVLKLWAGTNVYEIVLVGLGPLAQINAVDEGGAGIPKPYWLGLGETAAEVTAEYASSALYIIGRQQLSLNVKDFAYGYFTFERPSNRFTSAPDPPPSSLTVLGVPERPKELAVAEAFARGFLFASYITRTPANVGDTGYMADAAKYIANMSKYMTLTVLEKSEIELMGMGAYLAVTEGSETPPKFIHLAYTPPNASNGSVALIGKGITFDSGGYNLKGPFSQIEEMFMDKGGAASVLGAARILSILEPETGPEVHFISAVCENMISGDATRPGDIVTSAAGRTITIGNTDAEGRLTLVDAIWYAQSFVGVQKIVDIATLTGDAIAAVGPLYGAVMGRNRKQIDAVIESGARYGELAWQLPLEPLYASAVVGTGVADADNTVPSAPGAIGAALFLDAWVSPDVEWVHVDSAGPGFVGKPGYGATMLADWAMSQ